MNRPSIRALASATLSVVICLTGCDSGGGTRCSFQNPATLARSSWPKYQRDSQNTGAITAAPVRLNATIVAQFETTPPSPFVVQPVLGNGQPSDQPLDAVLYAGNTDGQLYALDTGTLARLDPSRFNFTGALSVRTTALVGVRSGQEALFFGSESGFVFAIDQTGAKQPGFFPFNVGGAVGRSLSLSPTDGTIYAGTLARNEVGICPNGVLRFLGTAIAPFTTSPAVSAGGNVVWAGEDRTLRMTRNDGFLLWTVSTSAPVAGGPVIATDEGGPDGEAVFAVDTNGRLFKVDAATGQLRYNVALPVGAGGGEPQVLAAPALAGDRLYIATTTGEVHSVDTSSGAVVWSHSLPGAIHAPLGVLVHSAGRSVVAASMDGNVYVIEDAGPQVGGTQTIPVGAAIRGGVAVSAAAPDRTVLFVADDGGRVSRIE